MIVLILLTSGFVPDNLCLGGNVMSLKFWAIVAAIISFGLYACGKVEAGNDVASTGWWIASTIGMAIAFFLAIACMWQPFEDIPDTADDFESY